MSDAPRLTPYDLFALAISLLAIMALGASITLPLSAESRDVLNILDWMLCVLFFGDFVRNLVVADNRLRYLYTWGWLDLLASIPAVDALRLGRFGRVVRILRLIRLVKASRTLLSLLRARRREGAVYGMGFVYVLVFFTAAILVLEAERLNPDANIRTAGDALWWTMTTISTVGYGDRYPVTTLGRVVATVLMVVGVGVFGTISGVAASWFAQPQVTQAKGAAEQPEMG